MTFEFDINKVNIIMQALSNMPYGQVADLVQDIRAQAQQQMQRQDSLQVSQPQEE